MLKCQVKQICLPSGLPLALFHIGTRNKSSKYEYLKIDKHREIAYRKTSGSNLPAIVFIPGFMSKMEGIKAQGLERYCREQNRTFVRFDIEGLGKSPGDTRTVQMKHWIEDCEHVIHKLTHGPVVLVGYSMGGWLALITAIQNPSRIHSLLLISPSLNFIWKFFVLAYNEASPEGKERLDSGKVYKFSSQYLEMFMRKDFAEKSKEHEIDLTKPIATKVPTRILHGMKDGNVPYSMSLKIADMLQSDDVDVIVRKQEVHHFTDPEDLELIYSNLTQLLRRYPVVNDKLKNQNSILKNVL